MTYYDIAKVIEPGRLEDGHAGGVLGCPEFFGLPDCTTGRNCIECWNRELNANEKADLLQRIHALNNLLRDGRP